MDAPKGYAWVPFGGSGDDKGTVIISGKGIDDPLVVKDVVIPFPVTRKAMDEYAEGRTYTVETADGETIEHHGVYALAAAKIPHDYESVRGGFRTKLQKGFRVIGEQVSAAFREIYRPGTGAASAKPTQEMVRAKAEEYVADGMEPMEAALAASRDFGLIK